MSNERDMEAPVTRRELYEALDIWLGAIMSRMDVSLDARFAAFDAKLDVKLDTKLGEQVAIIQADLARHVKVMEENGRRGLAVVDEQYKDLPPRVTRLEAKVFAPKRRRKG